MDPTPDGPPVTTHSPSYARLALALSKAQRVMGGAKKDATNPHLKSKYADLASVWDACREPLAANGLAVAQLLESDGSKATVKTMLLHESGEYLETSITAKGKDDNIQTLGSIITYLRRYSLSAMVGIAPEDDDGQAGQHGQATPQARQQPPARPTPGNAMDLPVEIPMVTTKQLQQLGIECARLFGPTPEDDARARKFIGQQVKREIVSRKALTETEAAVLITKFNATPAGKFFAASAQ